MSVEELCQLLKQKGVDEDDCALFRSKVHCWVQGRQLYLILYTSASKVNGRSFSKMKLVHIDKMGVSFGSRIIIETLLEDIVSSVHVVRSTKNIKNSASIINETHC